MRVLLTLIVLVTMGIVAHAQSTSVSARQSISITIVDHMDVKVEKQANYNGSNKSDGFAKVSSSKKNTVIFTDYITKNIAATKQQDILADNGSSASKMTKSATNAIQQGMLIHTISAY